MLAVAAAAVVSLTSCRGLFLPRDARLDARVRLTGALDQRWFVNRDDLKHGETCAVAAFNTVVTRDADTPAAEADALARQQREMLLSLLRALEEMPGLAVKPVAVVAANPMYRRLPGKGDTHPEAMSRTDGTLQRLTPAKLKYLVIPGSRGCRASDADDRPGWFKRWFGTTPELEPRDLAMLNSILETDLVFVVNSRVHVTTDYTGAPRARLELMEVIAAGRQETADYVYARHVRGEMALADDGAAAVDVPYPRVLNAWQRACELFRRDLQRQRR